MGRKSGSYKFEKRQKELKKQKKKQEKLARRQNRGVDTDELSEPAPSVGGLGVVPTTESDSND